MEEKVQEPGHKHSFIVISGELFVYMVLCKETRFKEKSKDNLLKRYVVLGCNLFDRVIWQRRFGILRVTAS